MRFNRKRKNNTHTEEPGRPSLFRKKRENAQMNKLKQEAELRQKSWEMQRNDEIKRDSKQKLKMAGYLLGAFLLGSTVHGMISGENSDQAATRVNEPAAAVETAVPEESAEPTAEPVTITYSLERKNKTGIINCQKGRTVDTLGLVEVIPGEEVPDDLVYEYKLEADPETLDCSVPGEAKVMYTLRYTDEKGNDVADKIEHVFQIADRDAPTITLDQTTLTIEQWAAFDPLANLVSVKDNLDGDATLLNEAPESSDICWYTVETNVDTSEAGRYHVSIQASDISGNTSKKQYFVVVNKAAPAKTETVAASVAGTETAGSTWTDPQPVYTETENNYSAPLAETYEVPQGNDYAVNTNTGKFHYTWCASAAKIKPGNRWDYTGSRDDLINMGYDPCKNCNP